MMLGMPLSPRRATRLLAAAVLALVLCPTAATAADLYTSPSGTLAAGAACSQADPCGIGRASLDAQAGDTVHIGAGTYGSFIAPLSYGIGTTAPSITWIADRGVQLFINNADSGSEGSFDVFPGQQLIGNGMRLNSRDPYGLGIKGNARVDRVFVTSEGGGTNKRACLLTADGDSSRTGQGALTNSACLTAPGVGGLPVGIDVQAGGNGQTFQILGSTGVSAEAGGVGVRFESKVATGGDPISTLAFDLSVAWAPNNASMLVGGLVSGTTIAAVLLRSSAYNGAIITSGQTDETRGTIANVTNPGFVDTGGDLQLTAASPLIDRFASSSPVAAPEVDLNGVRRDPANPEPGAYEANGRTVQLLSTTSGPTMTARVRPGAGGQLRLLLSSADGNQTLDLGAVAPSPATTDRPVTPSGLKPSTAYTARLELVDILGTVTSNPVNFTTAALARTCTVPRLKGLTLKRAKSRLAKAGCKLGKVRGRGTRVKSQKVKAGSVVAAGTSVGVRRG